MNLGEHSQAARTVREYSEAWRWRRAETDVFVIIAGSEHLIRKKQIVSSAGYSVRAVGMALHGLKERGLVKHVSGGFGLTDVEGIKYRNYLNDALVALGDGERV